MHLKPIFLWGYMGAGKSRLGKRLAKAMALEFIDLDSAIEQEFKLTIPNIFKQLGELEFRKMENQLIQKYSKQQNTVISCGGGAPCFFDNKNQMLQTGTVIYLSVDNEELKKRLWKNKTSRPIIALQSSKESLAEFIHQHLTDRMPYYAQAHLIYNNTFPKTDLTELIDWIRKQN